VIDSDTGGRELHRSFKPEFNILKLEQQSASFQDFIKTLMNEIYKLDVDDARLQDMTTILQVCEHLQPHVEANELPLEETTVVNILTHSRFRNVQIRR